MYNQEKAIDKLENQISNINVDMLKSIGKTINEIGKIRPTEVHKIQQVYLESALDAEEITRKIYEYTMIYNKGLEYILINEALKDIKKSEIYYKHRGLKKPTLKDERISNKIKAIRNLTMGELSNISNTSVVGLKDYNNRTIYYPIKTAYRNIIDKAIILRQSGVIDYNTAIKDTLNELGNSGIRVVYDSGYSRRLDSAVRQNILDGTSQLNQEILSILGNDFNSDGVELSTHLDCAPDHLPIQGRQFSNIEYAKLQSNQPFEDVQGNSYTAIKRPIGQWNCRHLSFPIILGVNKPEYTDEQLKQMILNNNKVKSFNGKKYTGYQATQEQRRLETEIRRNKEKLILFKSSGNKQETLRIQNNITNLTKKYKNFSYEMGLTPKLDRLKI